MALSDFPQIHFAGTSPRFRFWRQVTEKLVLGTAQVAGVIFTHLAHSVLWFCYSQLTLSELSYYLTDFSNILLVIAAKENR